MMPDYEDDDLPPDHMPFGEVLKWLRAKLGRSPSLEDVAAVRFAQQQRHARRTRRAALGACYRWPPRSGGDAPSPRSMVRDILGSAEMQPFWLAAQWLLHSLPVVVAADRRYDEWATRPDTVLRLAEAAASLPQGPVFAPPPRAEAGALAAYIAWKLSGVPKLEPGFVPAECASLDRRLAAAANAVTPEAAQRMRAALEHARDDGERRRLLREYRQIGERAAQQWSGVDWRNAGAPLGLLVEPEPELEPEVLEDEDEPPNGHQPVAGGRR